MSAHSIRLLCFERDNYPSHRADVEVLFARELAGRGHTIDLVMQAQSAEISPGRHKWCECNVIVGRTSSRHGFLGRALKHLLGFAHELATLRLMSSDRYDAVQVRDKFVIAAIALPIAHALGLKFFFWLSFPFPESELVLARSGTARFAPVNYARGALAGWLLYRWILPRSDHVFAQSERMKEAICTKGANPDKVTAVPMGVDLDGVQIAMAQSVTKHVGETVLGYLGTLDAMRKLDILLDMLAELRRADLPVRLLLVGDASEPHDREALERRAAALRVSQYIQITGFLPRREALQRIRAADICVSPIYPSAIFNVGSPTKLVEYMALGLPVVANSHPEQWQILRSSRAGVCVPWGARHFARGVRWLMNRDAAELRQMGQAGRSWALAHRAYPRIADNVERTYLARLGTTTASVRDES